MARDNPAARPSGTTEGMQEWIGESQLGCEYAKFEEWTSAIETLDDPEEYARYSKQGYDQTYAMNIFEDARAMERKLVEFSIHYAPKIDISSEKGGSSSTSDRSSAPGGSAQSLHAQMIGARQPFRGGRFAVKR